MGKITLTNIAEELAAASGMSKEASDNFIRLFIDTIEKGLLEDSLVKIKGLGTFKLMEVSDRGSVDINTGERITIKGYRKVSFTPDSAMKEFVNRPFAHFEPTELNEGYPSEEELSALEDDDKAEETITSEEQIDTVAEIAAEKSVMEEPVAEEVAVEEVDIPSESDSVPEQAGCSAHEGEEIGVQEETTVTDSPSANTDTVEEPVVIVSEQTSVEETEIPEQEEVPAVTLEQEEKEKSSIASEAAPEHCDTPSKKSSKRVALNIVSRRGQVDVHAKGCVELPMVCEEKLSLKSYDIETVVVESADVKVLTHVSRSICTSVRKADVTFCSRYARNKP